MNLVKPALEKDVGGTLTFDVPESGAITEAKVSVFDWGGSPIADLTNVDATVTGTTLSRAVPGTDVAVLGRDYLCKWTYKLDGVSVGVRRTTFEVVRAVLYKTLTEAKLTTIYAPLIRGRYPPGVTSWQNAIDRGWALMQARIRGAAKDPNLIKDPRPLEPAHALYTASVIASNYSPGGTQAAEWQEWAAAKRQQASEELDAVLANIEWYDAKEDDVPSPDEEDVPGMQLRISR